MSAAFDELHKETERCDFSPSEIIQRMRTAGSMYKDSTIRTHVTAHMLADGSLIRSSSGLYRLARHRDRATEPVPQTAPSGSDGRITEDEVKAAVKAHLEEGGWDVAVAWGRQRGIDIDACRADDRLVIEAKGEAPAGPQQVNYFLGALGELVQRMDDGSARYGLAFPDHRQYHGLVDRLPTLAWQRLDLVVYFVGRDRGNLPVVTSVVGNEPPTGT